MQLPARYTQDHQLLEEIRKERFLKSAEGAWLGEFGYRYLVSRTLRE